jgi:hypothetical protein
MSTKSLLRETIVPPRFGGARALVAPDRRAEFEVLAGKIWSEVLRRLSDPIATRTTPTRHSVTVLGYSRYVVDLRSGRLSLQNPVAGASPRRFRNVLYLFSADLPFRPTEALFEELLREWQSEVGPMAADPQTQITLLQCFRRAIRQACLQSCRWSVLRHRVRNALALDPETLDIARRTRANVGALEVTNTHYNRVVQNLPALRQLRDDNPNFLWLVGLAEAEGVALKVGTGGLIEALRELVLAQFKLPPAAWRFLANGRRSDFHIVLDWLGARANPKGRWLELREWLRLRVALGSDEVIPAAVQNILLHDYYQVAADGGSVVFRKATLPIHTLRVIIREAIARHRDGTLCAFVESELPDVLAWIGASGVTLDENQQKAGWHHLHHRAMAWKLDASLQSKRDELRWESQIGEHVAGHWRVTPVTDVWQLHRESQRQRNCMDNYLSDCLAGNVRMFAVQTLEGRRIGAIGLQRSGRQWHVLDARGFANTAPVTALTRLGEELAGRQTLLWQALHPLLEQNAPCGVADPTRQECVIVPGVDIATCVPYGDADSEDETEYDEEYEPEEEHDRACPICGCYEWDCSHLVATVDYFNGGLGGGALYDMKDELTDGLAERLLHMAKEGCSVTGCGEDFDRILRAIKKELPDWDDQQNLMDEYAGPILQAVLDQIGGLQGVEEHYWEFDCGMPGCSTCGRDFWAPDPESVIAELSAMLLISEDRPIRRSA